MESGGDAFSLSYRERDLHSRGLKMSLLSDVGPLEGLLDWGHIHLALRGLCWGGRKDLGAGEPRRGRGCLRKVLKNE